MVIWVGRIDYIVLGAILAQGIAFWSTQGSDYYKDFVLLMISEGKYKNEKRFEVKLKENVGEGNYKKL